MLSTDNLTKRNEKSVYNLSGLPDTIFYIMRAELKTLQDLLTLLDRKMEFKTKTLDTLEGTMFGHDAKVIIRTKLLNYATSERPWAQVQLWVSCGGEGIFTWGCVDRDDEVIIFDWWHAKRNEMDNADESKRRLIRQKFLEAQKEILQES